MSTKERLVSDHFQPRFAIGEGPQKPDFVIRDFAHVAYGVILRYNVQPQYEGSLLLLEFVEHGNEQGSHPMVWFDLEKWKPVSGSGSNLPDSSFERGLKAFMAQFKEDRRLSIRNFAFRARFIHLVHLAEKGYSIGYRELFPDQAKTPYPTVETPEGTLFVDDQYLVQPGELFQGVTIVLQGDQPQSQRGEAAAIVNISFDGNYEIVSCTISESSCHEVAHHLYRNETEMNLYRERMQKMRERGTKLQIRPKPYSQGGVRTEFLYSEGIERIRKRDMKVCFVLSSIGGPKNSHPTLFPKTRPQSLLRGDTTAAQRGVPSGFGRLPTRR